MTVQPRQARSDVSGRPGMQRPCPSSPAGLTEIRRVANGSIAAANTRRGRPRIYDLSMIDGDAADGFQGTGRGVLALEDPAPGSAMFFPADAIGRRRPDIRSGGSSLAASEVLQGATLLQRSLGQPGAQFHPRVHLAGRSLGYEIPWSAPSRQGLRHGLPPELDHACGADGPTGLHASSAVRPPAHRARALAARSSASGTLRGRLRSDVSEPTDLNAQVLRSRFTKQLQPARWNRDALVGVAVSPGIEIDFVRDGCTTRAGLRPDRDGRRTTIPPSAPSSHDHARRRTRRGWVMYLVDRLHGLSLRPIRSPPLCATATSLDRGPKPGATDPTKQYLNITPHDAAGDHAGHRRLAADAAAAGLPGPADAAPDGAVHVRRAVRHSRGRPDLSRHVRRHLRRRRPASGPALGCGGGTLPPTRLRAPAWDVVVNISELAPTVGGPIAVTYPEGIRPRPRSPRRIREHAAQQRLQQPDLAGRHARVGVRLRPAVVRRRRRTPPATGSGTTRRIALLMRSLARDFDTTPLHVHVPQPRRAGRSRWPRSSARRATQLKKDWVVTLRQGQEVRRMRPTSRRTARGTRPAARSRRNGRRSCRRSPRSAPRAAGCARSAQPRRRTQGTHRWCWMYVYKAAVH